MDESRNRETSVFFSYSRQDQALARPIIKAIEAMGFPVWWDGMLEGGTPFLETTEEALESAKAVVVLWSEQALSSHWVRDEASSGRDRARYIPLSLDGVMPPLGFRQVQIIEMDGWMKRDDALDHLGRALAKLHDRDYEPIDRRHLRDAVKQSEAVTLSRRQAILASVGLGAIGAIGVGGFYTLRSRQQSVPETRLAVLPFSHDGTNPEFDYLAQGLASAVRDELGRNRALQVVARSSSEAAANMGLDALSMGEQLGIGTLLEGRLESTAGGVDLICSLINARNGFQSWVRSFTYKPELVTTIRDQLVTAIITEVVDSSSDTNQPTSGMTDNPEAFLEYMKGDDSLVSAATLEAVQIARRHFERAVTIDPEFARAHADLSEVYLTLGAYASEPEIGRNLLDRAERSARRAVELAPDNPLLHAILGGVLQIGRLDFAAAAEPFERAKSLGLRDASGYSRYAVFLMSRGRTQDAVEQARLARGLDPLNPAASETLGLALFANRDYDDAIKAYRTALSFQPDRYSTHARMATAMIYAGNIEGGLSECSDERNLMERYPCEAFAATRQGDGEKSRAALASLISTFGDAAAYQEAQIEAEMGDYEQAMETLLKAERLRDTGLTLVAFDPAMDGLRDRADFKALLVRLGISA